MQEPEAGQAAHELLARASVPFDRLTAQLSAPATLRACGALLKALAELHAATRPQPGPLSKFAPAPRVFLAAYPILEHPEVVLSGTGTLERPLAIAARRMVQACEALIAELCAGGARTDAVAPALAAFQRGWSAYARDFRAWRAADAAGMEADLIRMAVALQSSAQRKLEDSLRAGNARRSPRTWRPCWPRWRRT